MSETETARLLRAVAFAARKHREQRRKGRSGTPYINHPVQVASLLAGAGHIDGALLCAAVLHDVVEDTETTPDELRAAFGTEVAALVAEVTDDRTLSSAERKQRQVEKARSMSPRARLIKLADKIDNVRDVAHDPPPDWSDERRRAYVDFAAAVVAGLRGADAALEAAFDAAAAEAYALLSA
jgi:guanosine-3',5'-bis(diphosphate) 3'-pyrophosphohydrolase